MMLALLAAVLLGDLILLPALLVNPLGRLLERRRECRDRENGLEIARATPIS